MNNVIILQKRQIWCFINSRVFNPATTVLALALMLIVFISGCQKSAPALPMHKLAAAVTPMPVVAAPLTVNLGTAASFTILTQTGITTTGVTSIQGDIGTSPITAAAMTGFGPVLDASGAFATSSLVSGRMYGPDYTGGTTPAKMVKAVSDMQAAFTNASMLTSSSTVSVAAAGDISGKTLTPGIYKYGSSLMIAGTGVTLNGGVNDVFVFQVGSALTVAGGTKITLTGGITAANVYWVIGSAATFGTYADFSGTILAKTAVTLNTGDIYTGHIYAQTAVTMIADKVMLPPPPINPLVGKVIVLLGYNHLFVSSEGNGYAPVMNDNRTAADLWEDFTVEDAGNGMVTLFSFGGLVSSNSQSGSPLFMSANRNPTPPTEDEKFNLVMNSDLTYSLQGSNGLYVTTNADNSMSCTSTTIGVSQKYTLLLPLFLDNVGRYDIIRNTQFLPAPPAPINTNNL